MKTNVIMKIAVVFMAAFGAYAFSGSANSQEMVYVHEGKICRNIDAPCGQSGDVLCVITLNSQPTQLWSDLGCSEPAYFNEI